MASDTAPCVIEVSQRSISTLDRSLDPFSVQILDACGILDIRHDEKELDSGSIEEHRQELGIVGPREEWALRWLLKKLQADDVKTGSPCLEPRAWLLLQELVVRMPLSSAARLLSTFKVTAIIKKTLKWIEQKIDSPLIPPPETEEVSTAADSSSGTLEVSPIKSQKISRKRKRNDQLTFQSVTSPETYLDVNYLYECICSTVKKVETLTRELPDGSRGFVVELVKSALRCSPGDAAMILGSSLAIANYTLTSSKRQPYHILENCISPILSLWKLRSITADEPSSQLSNRAFSTECLFLTLRLLNTYHQLPTSDLEKEPAVTSMEALVVTHIVLPARVSFLDSRRSKLVANGEINAPSIDELTAPLVENVSKPEEISPVSILFSIAVRCLPRDTPKQRTTESIWLQTLFRQLTGCESNLQSPSSPQKSLLRRMMQEAIDHQVHLNIPLLNTILSTYSGIFDENKSQDAIDWLLVSLCLRNDPDVFLLPSVPKNSLHNISPRTPNKLLTSLLIKITHAEWEQPLDSNEMYATTISDVVLPLVNAFAQARDLFGFIGHWQEQLVSYHEAQPSLGIQPLPSIWEADEIFHSVANLIESALTTEQIRKTLLAAHLNFQSPVMISSSSAYLVTLDCVISGCKGESTLSELAKNARMIYNSLVAWSLHSTNRSTRHKRRLWRILTTINSRWPETHISLHVLPIETTIVREAQDLMCQDDYCNGATSKLYYLEKLEVFRYLLSFIHVAKSQLQTRLRIAAAVASILDKREDLPNMPRLTESNEFHGLDPAPQWAGGSDDIKSKDIFFLGCVAQIIFLPMVFSCLDQDLKLRFFEALFCGALWHKMSSSQSGDSPPAKSIDYLKLWERFFGSDLLSEDKATCKCFRDFQVSKYLDAALAEEKTTRFFRSSYYRLAFESIQQIPLHTFQRKQRTAVANHLLSISMQGICSPTTLMSSVLLLAKLLEAPTKSMNILTELNRVEEEEEVTEAQPPKEGVLIRLAHLLEGQELNFKNFAISALKRLIGLVLRYQISTITQTNSVEYLKGYYEQVSKEVYRKCNPQYNCASAALIEVSLAFYWSHRKELAEILQETLESLANLRQRHLDSLLSHLSLCYEDMSRIQEFVEIERLSVLAECLASYTDLLSLHHNFGEASSTARRITKRIAERIASRNLGQPIEDGRITEHLSVSLARLELLLDVDDVEFPLQMSGAILVLRSLQSVQGKKSFLNHLQSLVLQREPKAQAELLAALATIPDGHHLDFETLLLLRRLISVQKGSDQQTESTTIVLSRILNVLCTELLRPQEDRISMLIMQCMNLLLQKQPQIVSQWQIDNTISAIAVMSRPLMFHTRGMNAGRTYKGLCTLFGTVLAIHRKKLGGRYHLIVPALEGLLRCLFVPYSKSSAKSGGLHAVGSELDDTHAATYARLLTMICDPTVSAVTGSKKKKAAQGLNDETRKARSIAGQHLLYLIMEYCNCQLEGRLLPAMKAALNHGLHAVLDVISPEAMRTLNAALSSSSRSIFKALNEDYRRSGRWQGT